MERVRGRTITFRNADQFFEYLTANKVTEVFVHPGKKQKYGDEYNGHDIFECAIGDDRLVRYETRFVIPRREGTELDRDGRVVDKFDNKSDLVNGLKEYGASPDLVKKLSTTKASELQEFFDSTKIDQAENVETSIQEKTTKVVKSTQQLKEGLLNHPHFKLAEISYDGHKYRLYLTLKTSPADASKTLRGRLKETKVTVFDAKLQLWQFNLDD